MKRLLSLMIVLMLAVLALPALAESGDESPAPQPPAVSAAPEATPEEADPAPVQMEEGEIAQTETPLPELPDDTGPAELSFTLPEKAAGSDWRLTDGVVMSRVSMEAGESVTAEFLSSKQGVLIQWYTVPAGGTVIEYDAAGAELSNRQVTFPAYLNLFTELDPNCRKVTLTVDTACALSEAKFYEAGTPLPDSVQRWEPTPEKADLMLVMAEPGPEFSELSGLLPLYAGEHRVNTVTVYASCEDRRSRAEEALSGLWAAGVRTYPVFLEQHARNYDMLKIVEEDWGTGETAAALQAVLETYRPEVVVSHNAADTTDRFPTRGFTARCLAKAAENASWQVKKLYLLAPSDENGAVPGGATVPDFSLPLATWGGATAAETAQSIYQTYTTRQVFTRIVAEAPGFLLDRTTVGDDEAKDDLFEHIDVAALTRYETPAALPEATAEPVAGTTDQQTELPATAAPAMEPGAPTPAPESRLSKAVAPIPQNATLGKLLPVIGGILLTILLLVVLRSRMDAWWAIVLSFAPAVAGIVLYFAVMGGTLGLDTGTPKKAEALTPSSTPTATPTIAPTPIPATVMEPTYFRKEGEPDETVIYDSEHGHWEYRTDLLGIYIDRIAAVTKEDKPLAYFVADIYMKDVNQFRPAFGSDGHTGMGAIFPWIIARRAKAVLWITGDNMVNSDRDEKGVIIRDGRLYLDEEVEDTLAIYPDMSLRIYKKWNQDADMMLEDGVENTYSFGPTLVENGTVNLQAYKHRVRRANPRVGIGMVEPGHYVAIVVDGRQKDYSVGLPVEDFAEMFLEYGCVTAYNMDGGLSAGMIFMGEQLNSHGGQRTGSNNDLSYQRPVPDGLIFGFSEQVPGLDDPLENDGNRKK